MDIVNGGQLTFYLVLFVASVVALIFSTIYTMKTLKSEDKKNANEQSKKESKESMRSEGHTKNIQTKNCPDHKGDGDGQEGEKDSDRWDDVDPVEYCEHIPSQVKKIQHRTTVKKIEEGLSNEQLEDEKKIQQKQLEAIYSLMQGENDKFGVDSMEDVTSQMKLYA